MEPLIEPNLNADVYRNMTAADRPLVPDKHLQFILIYDEKSAILGGSNMTDRYWSGTIWYYNDISDFDREKAFVAKKTESGVCAAVYLESDKFIIGEDTGALTIFDISTEPDGVKELQCAAYACLHDSSLLTLSAFADKKKVVSGGMDCCIKVWDVTELMVTQSFDYAHIDTVTCVDVKPKSNTEFASTSSDCEALLWDIRQIKPAQSILKRDVGLTAVSWNPNIENFLAIGTDNGEVVIVDARRSDIEVLRELSAFTRPVHKLLFNPNAEKLEELAVCCDNTSVEVLDINSQFSPIYKDNRHTDFVRGLTWFNNYLYSCSWDNTALKHTMDFEDI
ncbi:Methylosome protein 50 [Habropoda laboriosa]|uniref:Methylosome protein 50 n=1 Tax=Habropoda laboriosa TaxID=597456 RepID=A0A0L7R976_9HYME|nr:PREDICTED: methylosome protein 50-like [Habropoda laboriosa]KOC67425.1 Methylosome protein 50 [Habropoda laboriosa]